MVHRFLKMYVVLPRNNNPSGFYVLFLLPLKHVTYVPYRRPTRLSSDGWSFGPNDELLGLESRYKSVALSIAKVSCTSIRSISKHTLNTYHYSMELTLKSERMGHPTSSPFVARVAKEYCNLSRRSSETASPDHHRLLKPMSTRPRIPYHSLPLEELHELPVYMQTLRRLANTNCHLCLRRNHLTLQC